MNNPLRAAVQRHYEARWFLHLGGAVPGAKALEIGCGRGVGVEIILDRFKAASVDAFDLDPRMVTRARRRLRGREPQVRLWVGDAAAITAPDAAYEAVFDFGIIHHVPDWRAVLAEVYRVLKPGGKFYAEEPLGRVLIHPLVHRFFAHPVEDRFDAMDFRRALQVAGLFPTREQQLKGLFIWLIATKPGLIPLQPEKGNHPNHKHTL